MNLLTRFLEEKCLHGDDLRYLVVRARNIKILLLYNRRTNEIAVIHQEFIETKGDEL